MTQPAARHLFGLDLLRFGAALLVLLNHFALFAPDRPTRLFGEGQAWPLLAPIGGVGGVGVEIFFVISGFVITMSAAGLSGRSGALRFAASRAARLLPALWLSTLIGAGALLYLGEPLADVAAKALRSALFVPVGPYVDGVVWSLLVEAVFYTLIALAILSGREVPVRRIAYALGGASTLFLALLISARIVDADGAVGLLERFPFKLLLLRHGVFFAIGMLVWQGWTRGTARPDRAAIAVFALFGMAEIAMQNGSLSLQAAGAIGLWLAGMGWLTLSLRPGFAEAFRAPLRHLGDLSYPLYLNHVTLGMVLLWALDRSGFGAAASFGLILAAVLLTSIAVLAIERACQARLRPWLARIPRQGGTVPLAPWALRLRLSRKAG